MVGRKVCSPREDNLTVFSARGQEPSQQLESHLDSEKAYSNLDVLELGEICRSGPSPRKTNNLKEWGLLLGASRVPFLFPPSPVALAELQ